MKVIEKLNHNGVIYEYEKLYNRFKKLIPMVRFFKSHSGIGLTFPPPSIYSSVDLFLSFQAKNIPITPEMPRTRPRTKKSCH